MLDLKTSQILSTDKESIAVITPEKTQENSTSAKFPFMSNAASIDTGEKETTNDDMSDIPQNTTKETST